VRLGRVTAAGHRRRTFAVTTRPRQQTAIRPILTDGRCYLHRPATMRPTRSGHALTLGVFNKEAPEFHRSSGTRISVRRLGIRSLPERGPKSPRIEDAFALPWPPALLTAARAPGRLCTLPSP